MIFKTINFKEKFLNDLIIYVTIEQRFSNILRKNLSAQKYVKYTTWTQVGV